MAFVCFLFVLVLFTCLFCNVWDCSLLFKPPEDVPWVAWRGWWPPLGEAGQGWLLAPTALYLCGDEGFVAKTGFACSRCVP